MGATHSAHTAPAQRSYGSRPSTASRAGPPLKGCGSKRTSTRGLFLRFGTTGPRAANPSVLSDDALYGASGIFTGTS